MKLAFQVACLLVSLLAIFGEYAAGQNASFYLRNQDRVVFYGDSITEQAFYTNFIETFVVTRFPGWKVDFVNSGWSGDKIWGGDGGSLDERLKRDVFPHKPTVVTAMLGMNDGCYSDFDPKCFEPFAEFYGKFVTSIKRDPAAIRLTLLQPSPFDDWTDSHAWRLPPPIKNGYNNVVARYGEYVKQLAAKHNLATADLNAPLVDVILRAQRADRNLAQKIIPDRIHPGAAGGLIMAAQVLKVWNAPSLVADVEIDVSGKKVGRAGNAHVTELKFNRGVSWTQIDRSLPLPIDEKDKAVVLVAELANIADSLNRQMLKATGLSAMQYDLIIDGVRMKSFSREELAGGVNLSMLPTPMAKQAATVHELTQQHNKVHFLRWREVQLPFAKKRLAAAPKLLSDLDTVEAELVTRQRAAAQPKAHRFELVPRR